MRDLEGDPQDQMGMCYVSEILDTAFAHYLNLGLTYPPRRRIRMSALQMDARVDGKACAGPDGSVVRDTVQVQDPTETK